MRARGGNRESPGTFGCQLVRTSRRPGRRILRASAAAAAGSAAKWNASIEMAASAPAAGSPVLVRSPTVNRARPASPNSPARRAACSTAIGRSRPPPGRHLPLGPATVPGRRARGDIDQRLARPEARGLKHMAQQACRDKRERLNLSRQARFGCHSPDPPDPGEADALEGLVKIGGGRRRRGFGWHRFTSGSEQSGHHKPVIRLRARAPFTIFVSIGRYDDRADAGRRVG